MAHRYTRPFRVRSYECDALGHVNNAVYQQYLEQTAIEASDDAGYVSAWYQAHGTAWVLRRVTIEYLHPAFAQETLEVRTWVSSWRRVRAQREYLVRRPVDDTVIARASADWVYVDRMTAFPRRIPDEAVRDFGTGDPSAVALTSLPEHGLEAGSFYWRHPVTCYEIDSMQHVNNAVYLNWVQEAKFRAAAASGWPMERMQAEGFVTVQIRHDTEYFLPAKYGDEIEIVSRLYEVRRVRGTWLQEVYRLGSGELLARNYSTGAFLDLQGRPIRPPSAMFEALLRGEG